MEQLLKEIIESKKLWDNHKDTFCGSRGKGTVKYTLDRIQVLRSQLLEIQNEMKYYWDNYYKNKDKEDK